MNDKESEVEEETIGLRIAPTYQKLYAPIQIKIDEMFWAGKKLTFYLIETGAESTQDVPPEYHIYVERIDTTVDEEPLFSIIETKRFKLAKLLWVNLQKLKECLLATDV